MTSPVARRYAQTFLEKAEAGGDVAALDADVALIGETLAGSRDLQLLMASPVVPADKKRRVAEALFGGKVSTGAQQLLSFLFEKGREGELARIIEAYQTLRDAQTGVVEARVRVPRALGADEQAAVKRQLEARTGKTVRLSVTVDPSLLGGIVVRLGDTVYDGSVRHQLETLRERLDTPAISMN